MSKDSFSSEFRGSHLWRTVRQYVCRIITRLRHLIWEQFTRGLVKENEK